MPQIETTSPGTCGSATVVTLENPVRKQRLDPVARTMLLTRHIGMVRRVAFRMASRYPSCVQVEDLVNMGMLGLIDAVDRFEEDRCLSFTAYARIRVKGAIVDEMRRVDWVPRSVRDRGDRLRVAREQLAKDLGRTPTEPELARQLGVTEQRLQELADHSLIHNVVSMEEGADDEHTLGDAIPAASDSPDVEFETSDLRKEVRSAIGGLPERDRMIVEMYYFREIGFKEIGQILGVTESRVSQLHTRIMERLRPKLAELAAS
ncbi:MAG: FliA/WhiG family RNA polymerase sigma factor [Myxococcales bacterium]|nr:FliA/WhiG family RNA polymerase sigma factor [Myxococcales bacterium]